MHRSRRFKRKLTPFLCQEMLYDYATDRLDPERKADVTDFLEQDKTSKEAYRSIQAGLEYVAALSNAEVSEKTLSAIAQTENIRTNTARATKWSNWPESVRWSITAVAISVIVALMIVVIPWKKLPNFTSPAKKSDGTVALADIKLSNEITQSDEPAADEAEQSNPEMETSGDEHEAPGGEMPPGEQVYADGEDGGAFPPPKAIDNVQTIKGAKAEAKLQTIKETPKLLSKEVATSLAASAMEFPTQAPIRPGSEQLVHSVQARALAKKQIAAADKPAETKTAAIAKQPEQLPTAPTQTTAQTKVQPTPAEIHEKKPQGFVYRAFMNLPNVDSQAPEIAEKLGGLGAEKAGEVPLGWKRGTGSYFHFSLPESNEEAALEMLRTYGPVRISKDPHPRVMPKGQVRFILWIEPSNHEAQPETEQQQPSNETQQPDEPSSQEP